MLLVEIVCGMWRSIPFETHYIVWKRKKPDHKKIHMPHYSEEPIHYGIINQLERVDKEKVFLHH
jgi:hypothetical protein